MAEQSPRITYLAGWVTAVIALVNQGKLPFDTGVQFLRDMLAEADYDEERRVIRGAIGELEHQQAMSYVPESDSK